MKKITFTFLVALTIVLFGCQESEQPTSPSLIGEWEASSTGDFLRLYLDGVETNPTAFGAEVFQLNDSEASPYVEAYLQNQVLGPIDLNSGNITFEGNNQLLAQLASQSIEGTWNLYNDQSRLRLQANGLPLDQYDFDLIKLTASEMELKFNGTIELIQENRNEAYNFKVLLNFKKR